MVAVNQHLLKAIRNGTGKTQQKVADQIGIHVKQYAKYERGEQEPKVTTAKKIAEALETPLDVVAEFYKKS